MAGRILPRYPVYIPSKGRHHTCQTASALQKDGIPYHLVIEPQEADAYASRFGRDRLLILPFRDAGSVIPARNWIKDHAMKAGHERHWQLDDNIQRFFRRWKAERIPCRAGLVLRAVEDFADRYENVAIAGLNYDMFMPEGQSFPPFNVNVHVYSCSLILNSLTYQWRGRYNEDTDYCLQVLSGGWCTVLFNAFLAKKIWTMTVKGGNTDALYQGDGRLRMARSLEQAWPGVVTITRKYQRPQHHIKGHWRFFDTPLKLKPGMDLNALPKVDEYGMRLTAVRPVKSPYLRHLIEDHAQLRASLGNGDHHAKL